jgi:hypothetical protein
MKAPPLPPATAWDRGATAHAGRLVGLTRPKAFSRWRAARGWLGNDGVRATAMDPLMKAPPLSPATAYDRDATAHRCSLVGLTRPKAFSRWRAARGWLGNDGVRAKAMDPLMKAPPLSPATAYDRGATAHAGSLVGLTRPKALSRWRAARGWLGNDGVRAVASDPIIAEPGPTPSKRKKGSGSCAAVRAPCVPEVPLRES